MRAMVLEKVGTLLALRDFPKPKLGRGQLLVRVNSCAVCRTDLHIVDGELPDPKLPLVLGHQIVGLVSGVGNGASRFSMGERLGVYGFGASAHIIAQVARWQARRVFAFTRAGDEEGQRFARSLGAEWAGSSTERPPEELDAAIIFAPVGELVPAALAAVAKGGVVVCAGIHMSDIPSFPYELLWGERVLRSVANLTRRDGVDFLELAPRVPVRTQVEV